MEDVLLKTTHAAGQVSAGVTLYFGFTLNELGIIVGIASSIAMAVLNAVFLWRRDRRELIEHRDKLRD